MATPDDIARVAAEIRRRGGSAALTGAGISVESGIPDFRSGGGIWTRYDPREYATIDAFLANPVKVWRFFLELGGMLHGARPNPAHTALAALERAGLLAGIATQNIDALHQAAGSTRVHELHGTGARLRCVRCAAPATETEAEIRAGLAEGRAPSCASCGGHVKPDVILFGEMLPPAVYAEAELMIKRAPVVLVVGTSATVWPVAGLPEKAKRRGALIVEVNLDETELTGDVADISLLGKAGDILPRLVGELS